MAPRSLIYESNYLSLSESRQILDYVRGLQPLFEDRYSKSNPPPQGQLQRPLLRPVYWLGNWQFACLDYYRPPQGLFNRCVRAEPFPDFLQALVNRIEDKIKLEIFAKDIPRSWQLNTCLINFYGDRFDKNSSEDVARVGEHKDFEPGPVASLSFGERALFQFVESRNRDSRSHVVLQQWLEDRSLQVFSGDRFKKKLFHRVQRVENKSKSEMGFRTPGFRTRRLNLTFRYVPREHFVDFCRLPESLQQDLQKYLEVLAQGSPFWQSQISP